MKPLEKVLKGMVLTDEEIDELYKDSIEEEEEYYQECDDIPEGCAACGGPYPQCTTSCKLFDD